MKDVEKTKKDLIIELRELRRHLSELQMNKSDREEEGDGHRKEEAWFRALIENGVSVYVVVDVESLVAYVSPSLERIYGWQSEEILGKSIFELVHPDDMDYARRSFREISDKPGSSKTVELRCRHKDGSWRTMRVSGVNLLDNPVVAGIALASHDITERGEMEQQLRESEERYHSLFESSPFPLLEIDCSEIKKRIDTLTESGVTDIRGYLQNHPEEVSQCVAKIKTLDVNLATLRLYQAESKEQFGTDLVGLWTEKAYGVFREGMIAFAGGETTFERETVARTFEGEEKHIVFCCSLAPGFEATWSRVLVSNVDITEHKETEELRRSEARLRQLAENIPQVFWMSDAETKELLYVSPAYEEIWGRTRESVYREPLSWLRGVHPEDRERVMVAVRRTVYGDYDEEYRIVRPDGAVRTVRDRVFPIQDETGQVYRLAGVTEDITDRKHAEEKVRFLYSAIEQSSEGIAVSDMDGNLLFVNNAMAAMHGYIPEELSGKHLSVFHTPEQMPSVQAANRQLRQEREFSGEIWHARRDGTAFPTLMHNSLLQDKAGNPMGMIATLRDTTEQKRVEQELRHHTVRLKILHEMDHGILSAQSPEAIAEVAAAGLRKLICCARVSVVEFDLDASEGTILAVSEDTKTDLAAGVHLPLHTFGDIEQLLEGKVRTVEDILTLTSPNRVHQALYTAGVRSWTTMPLISGGQLVGSLNLGRGSRGAFPAEEVEIAHEVADRLAVAIQRKRAEKALRESELQYRTTIDSMGDLIHVIDTELRLLLFNKSLEKWFRDRNLEPRGIGQQILEVFPFLPDAIRDEYEEVLRTGNTLVTEENTTIGEREYTTVVRKIPVFEEGKVSRVVTVIRDITEARKAEEGLRESEERYRALFEQAADTIVVIDAGTGAIVEFNDKAHENLGYTRREFEKLKISDFDIFDTPEEVARHLQKIVREGPDVFETKHRTKTGEIRDIEVSSRAIHVRERDFVQSIWRDITDRKRAEEALAAEKERLAVTLQSIADGVIATNHQGRVSLLNAVAERLTGWTQQEAVSKPLSDLFTVIHEKTGEPREDPVKQVLRTNLTVEMATDTLLIARDGTERMIAYSASPMRDREGTTIGVVVVFRDITEMRRMEDEVLNAKRIESLGLLAGGIAHDFNNTLTAATGNLFLAKARAGADRDMLEMLIGAEKAIFQAKRLTRQLLAFSKGGAPIKETASLPELLRETVEFALSGSNVKCEFSIPQHLWAVEVDVAQISQVINNLVLNAAQAMPGGGVIKVSAENAKAAEERSLPLGEGKYVRISVEDSGVGIPREHFGRIFSPYFTTKPGGSGLGLATAYTIVSRHSGHITFESEPGVGTTFRVYLPASDKMIPEKKGEVQKPIPGKGRILLMDDEQDVRNTTREVLRHLGYEVDLAREGMEAVEQYTAARKSDRPYDAVILDLTVAGGMGGKEAMARLLEVDPTTKALVSSGYSNDPVMANYRKHGFADVITKPYKGEELSEKLHRMLRGTGN
jgi:two-component system cell cycle sensor histidine kinase/response regulator CckA